MKLSEEAKMSNSSGTTVENKQIDPKTMEIWTKKVNVP